AGMGEDCSQIAYGGVGGRFAGMASIQGGRSAFRRVAANPLLELLERMGYLVRGALYVVMGLLALGIALRIGGGQTTDLSGSLVFLVGNPFGRSEERRVGKG